MIDINEARTVPVKEDLTTYGLELWILRGTETMTRRDYPLAAGVQLAKGEWGVLNGDGKVERPSATPSPSTHLCFLGTDRYDVKATGKVTLILNSNLLVRTKRFDAQQNYEVGDYLTVKDLGGGEAVVTLAGNGEVKLAKVEAVTPEYLEFTVFPPQA